jgi:hypothetical protein
MGKASSSKKVARAAGTSGGRTARGRTPWMYYLILVAVVAVGSAMVYTSRQHRLQVVAAGGTATPPTVGTTWNVGYAVYECTSSTKGKFLPAFTDHNNPHGIYTPTAGVIQVSPKSDSVAGKNATLDKFASAVHMTVNAGELNAPGGKDFRDGDDCGGKPGRVQVQVFSSPTDTVGITSTLDPALVRFQDNILLTIAFMPKGATIPPPPKQVLTNLAAAVTATTASTSTTTAPAAPAPSTPAASTPAASTTPGATTTAPAAATTTPSATTTPATTAPATTATTAKK